MTRYALSTVQIARPWADRQCRTITGVPLTPLLMGPDNAVQGRRSKPVGAICTLPQHNSRQNNINSNASNLLLRGFCIYIVKQACYRKDIYKKGWGKVSRIKPHYVVRTRSRILWNFLFQISKRTLDKRLSEALLLGSSMKFRNSFAILSIEVMGTEDRLRVVESISTRG